MAGRVKLGYALSSEEHRSNDLVRFAQAAEQAGFDFALISDHYHPWIDQQGNSPFAWSVLGGIAQATSRIILGTGVTCPLIRYHPALVAQMAATLADMAPGRFWLGVGSGENLNEHILGTQWPAIDEREEMLEEAISIIRELWQGGVQTYRGAYYTVDHARIYTLPEQPPLINVAASGARSARIAATLGDGLISIKPSAELVRSFESEGGQGKPRIGQIHVCWAEREDEALRTAMKWWPNAAIKGDLSQELPQPKHFEQAAQMVTEQSLAQEVPCGPDPEKHLAAIRKFADAGFDHVYVHQIGPDQEGFFRFYEREVLPSLTTAMA